MLSRRCLFAAPPKFGAMVRGKTARVRMAMFDFPITFTTLRYLSFVVGFSTAILQLPAQMPQLFVVHACRSTDARNKITRGGLIRRWRYGEMARNHQNNPLGPREMNRTNECSQSADAPTTPLDTRQHTRSAAVVRERTRRGVCEVPAPGAMPANSNAAQMGSGAMRGLQAKPMRSSKKRRARRRSYGLEQNAKPQITRRRHGWQRVRRPAD